MKEWWFFHFHYVLYGITLNGRDLKNIQTHERVANIESIKSIYYELIFVWFLIVKYKTSWKNRWTYWYMYSGPKNYWPTSTSSVYFFCSIRTTLANDHILVWLRPLLYLIYMLKVLVFQLLSFLFYWWNNNNISIFHVQKLLAQK